MAATMTPTHLYDTSSTVATTVIWDIANCPIPRNYAGYQVVRKIKDYLLAKNHQIQNFISVGNHDALGTKLRQELEGSAVILHNVSSTKPQNAVDIAILTELMKLTYFNKPPHSIILLTGDRDFSKVCSFLETVHFKITLVHHNQISDTLRYSVRDVVRWTDLLGQESSNQTPDIQKPKKFSLTKPGKNTTTPSTQNPESAPYGIATPKTSALSLVESGALSEAFVPLIDYLCSQDSGSQTMANIEDALGEVYTEFGFKSFSEYMESAEANGVVVNEVHGGGKKIARLHNYGKDYFVRLIEYLQASPDDAVLFSKLGEECISKKMLAEHGFPNLRPYIEKAARCGIVKIIVNDHGHRIAQLRPNYSLNAKLANAPSKFSLKVHVPKHKRGLLIGPNGTNVLKLEKELKVKLTLRDPYCFVSSDDENLAVKAVEYLTTVYRGQMESEQAVKSSGKTIRFEVPGALVGQIKGRKGSKCHGLEEELNVDIDIPKLKGTEDGNATVMISVIGEEENALQCKERILAIVKKHSQQQFAQHSRNKHDRTLSTSSSSTSSFTSSDHQQLTGSKESALPEPFEYHRDQHIERAESVDIRKDFHSTESLLPRKQQTENSMTSRAADPILLQNEPSKSKSLSLGLDSDQSTLSRSQSPLLSINQAEQEALIPSFLLGNDTDESPPNLRNDANSIVRRQKAVLSSLVKVKDEGNSRLFSYVNSADLARH